MIEVSDMAWQANHEQEGTGGLNAKASRPAAIATAADEACGFVSPLLFSAISPPQLCLSSSSLFFFLLLFIVFLFPSQNCMKTKINSGGGGGRDATDEGTEGREREHGRTFILVPEDSN